MLWDKDCFLSHLLCSDESVTRHSVMLESAKIFFSFYWGSFWWFEYIFKMHMGQGFMSIVFWITFTSKMRKLRKQLCTPYLITNLDYNLIKENCMSPPGVKLMPNRLWDQHSVTELLDSWDEVCKYVSL